MVDILGPTDQVTASNVPIDPTSNNPIEVNQTSYVELVEVGGGAPERGLEVAVELTGSNVAEQVNIAIVIDTSGSTADDSGTDFDGNGTNETILEAELLAAAELFDAYVDAGYDPAEVTINLVTYSTGSEVRGTFTLDQRDDFFAELVAIDVDGSSGFTNMEAGLNAAGDAFTAAGADPADTNIVAFLSDGEATGAQDIAGAAANLESDWNALITGIGVGANSSLDDLNELDNTGGADQVLSGQELLDIVVAPLTDADFLRFEITIEGLDANGDPVTETFTVLEGDPAISTTQLGWTINNLEIDPTLFPTPQDVTFTFDAYFAEDPGDPGSGEQVVTTVHNLPLVLCFTPGTMILTPMGQVAIEDLEEGDRVITRDHGVQRIRWIGSTTLSAAFVGAYPSLRPILIRKGALGNDLPEQDMRLSRQHRVLVRDWRSEVMFGVEGGVLVPAFTLCNDSTIVEERPVAPVTYIHMAFDDHEVVYADGIEAESFHPAERTVSHLNTEQREELFALFPELLEGDGFAFDASRRMVRNHDARLLRPASSEKAS